MTLVKFIKHHFALQAFLIFLCFFTSFSAHSTVNVSGNQSGIWTKANSPYIMTGTVTVATGHSLIIQPGVTVIFANYSVDLIVNGTLTAIGTAADSIRLKGQYYAPYNTYYGGSIYLNTNTINLSYIRSDSLGYSNNAILIADNTTPVLTNSTIKNDNRNLDIYTWIGGGKNFVNVSGIVYVKSLTYGTDATIVKMGAGGYYYFLGGVTFNAGTKLTIKPGASILFQHYGVDLVVNGKLDAQGTVSDSIRFRGQYYPPYNTYYGGSVYVNGDSSVVNYLSVDSMGYYTSSVIVADGMTPSITNTSVKHTNTNDIYTWIGGAKNFLNLNATILIKSQAVGSDATIPKIGGNSYYVFNGGVTMNAGTRLTIKPGVRLVFPYMNTSLALNGILDAQGTAADSIRFIGRYNTSNGNSDHGGYIALYKDSSIINYAVIDSMGDSYYNTTTIVMASNSTISNTVIKNSETSGIVVSDGMRPVISNTIVKNSNGYDYYSWPGGFSGLSAFTGNVYVKAGNVNVNSTFPKYNATNTFYNLLGTVTIDAPAKLTIQPGVTISFPYMYTSLVANGILLAQGTTTDSIRFIGKYNTSNGSSDHGGIIALNKDSSIIDYAVIDSMGDTYYFTSAVALASNSTINHTTIKNTESSGIIISDGIRPVISNTVVKNSSSTYDLYTWIGGVNNLSSFTGNVNIKSGNLGITSTLPKYNTSGVYYNLLGGITVDAPGKLIVKPGVTIGLPYMYTSLVVNGLLDAQGTVSDSIRFTGKYNASNSNSNYGGNVSLNKDSSIINYLVIDSMGDTYYSTSALAINAYATVNNSVIKNTESSGIYIGDGLRPVISNSVIKNSLSLDVYSWIGGLDKTSNLTATVHIKASSLGVNALLPKLTGSASYYRLLGNVYINNGSTLTMQPGVKVLFPNFSYSLIVNGILNAQGTVADSIKFYGKSAYDYNGNSSHGGAVYFYKDSSVLDYVGIDSMGDSYYYPGAVVIADDVITAITNSTITHSESSDIYTWVGAGKKMDNIKAVIALRSYSINANNTIYKVKGSYYKMTGGITLNAGYTLNIQPGVTIISPAANVNFAFNGILKAIGSPTDSIKFKGTRNLANSTLYGGSFYINHDSSVLKYVVADSLGDANGTGGLVFYGGCLLQYCTIKNCKYAGLYINSSNVNASYTDITKNENGAIVYNCKPSLNSCNISSNTNFGINVTYKSFSTNALNSYWGTASGPFHGTLNPSGTGNPVSDSVNFIPFKTTKVFPVLPYIASFSPTAGATDTVIVIKGIRFTGTTAVRFGGTSAKSFTVVNDSTINAVVNAGASGQVKVTRSQGSDSLDGFVYCSGVVISQGFSFTTNFSDISFTNISINTTSTFWDFGDATSGADFSPVHHYSNPGTYTACLISGNACSHTADTLCKVVPLVGIAFDDADRDGLFDPTEAGLYGTSNTVFDSNNDGLADGINVFTGFLVLSPDTDGDGISNLQEMLNGTNPLLSDTDFDGVPDNLDAYPLDRYRSKLPPANAGDHTAPVITLTEPF